MKDQLKPGDGAALRATDVRCGACHAPRPGRS